jgi:hypothetical protein
VTGGRNKRLFTHQHAHLIIAERQKFNEKQLYAQALEAYNKAKKIFEEINYRWRGLMRR